MRRGGGGPFKLELFEQQRNKAHSVQGLADVDFFNFGVGSLKEGREKNVRLGVHKINRGQEGLGCLSDCIIDDISLYSLPIYLG